MSSFAPARRRLAAALAVVASCAMAGGAKAADPPPTYAVVSLIGDQVTVVKRRPAFGRASPNELLQIPVADASFDRMAMNAAEAAIQRARPGARVFQASIRDKRLFALQDGLLKETPESRDMRAALRGLLASHGATHLVIVTKRRSPASFKLRDHSVGEGVLAGIGFYVDSVTPVRHVGSGEDIPGFLSPYAYLDVSVLEAGSLRSLKAGTALESRMRLTVDSKQAVRAWDALTPEEKVEALQAVIESGVARATAEALAE